MPGAVLGNLNVVLPISPANRTRQVSLPILRKQKQGSHAGLLEAGGR